MTFVEGCFQDSVAITRIANQLQGVVAIDVGQGSISMVGEKTLDAVEPSVDHCFNQSCSAFMVLVAQGPE